MKVPSKMSMLRKGALASVAVMSLMVAATHVAEARIVVQDAAPQVSAYTLIAAGRAANKGAENFISSVAQRGIDFLGNGQQTQTQKTESFKRLLEDSFDLDAIGRFAAGQYWRQFTPAQQSEYVKLFRRGVVDMYAQRFSEYNGQKLEVTGSRPAGNAANDTVVMSRVISPNGAEPVPVEWVVQSKGGKYKVLDVIILGTSQSINQRSQFKEIVQKGGGDVQALIDNLRQTRG
jgi:phospholipid transport system substrate-binding protein